MPGERKRWIIKASHYEWNFIPAAFVSTTNEPSSDCIGPKEINEYFCPPHRQHRYVFELKLKCIHVPEYYKSRIKFRLRKRSTVNKSVITLQGI